MIGGQDCWNILKQMEATAVNSAKVIANKQLTFNGFDLCYRRDLTGTISVLEITGMTTLIPGFGVQDLKELLTLLSVTFFSSDFFFFLIFISFSSDFFVLITKPFLLEKF